MSKEANTEIIAESCRKDKKVPCGSESGEAEPHQRCNAAMLRLAGPSYYVHTQPYAPK